MDYWFFKWRNKNINESKKDTSLRSKIIVCALSFTLGITGFCTGGMKFFSFIALVYSNLAEWGLPGRKHDFPSVNKINSTKNVFQLEHGFITRSMFNKMSKRQYQKYLEQIEKYDTDGGAYASSWEEWKYQGIKSML